MKRDIVRERLLTAAETVFERHGFEKTTLDDLGREAGLNKTSLYYYYPNKEEIFSAVINRQLGLFLASLDSKVNKKKNGKNGLKAYMENRSLVLKKFSLLSKYQDTLSPEIEAKEIAFINQLIHKGIEEKELRKSVDKGASLILSALKSIQSGKEQALLISFLFEGMNKKKKEMAESSQGV